MRPPRPTRTDDGSSTEHGRRGRRTRRRTSLASRVAAPVLADTDHLLDKDAAAVFPRGSASHPPQVGGHV